MYIFPYTHTQSYVYIHNSLPKFMNKKARYICPHITDSVLRSLVTFRCVDIPALYEVLQLWLRLGADTNPRSEYSIY